MPKTILVVDDEPVMVELSKRTLEEKGYAIMTASNGEEALVQLKSKKPDLILLDVQMPKMNGYTFVIEKSKLSDFASVPVIVLTSLNEVEPLFKRHGVRGYLLKPLKVQELLDKVQAILGSPS